MTGPRRILLSYLTLALVFVGALGHGFLSQPAGRMRMLANGVTEGAGFADRGLLPTLRGVRSLSDLRKPRTVPGGKGDTALMTWSIVPVRDAGPSRPAFVADNGRHAVAPRRAHRPRDPPVAI